MIGSSVTTQLNPNRVLKAVDTAAFKNLNHAAASIRKTAIESIYFTKEIIGYIRVKTKSGKSVVRKLYRPAPVGMPVYGHKNRGLFRRAIRFDVDKKKQDAFIGPSATVVGDVMKVHEFGGVRGQQRYAARPTMRPAMEENLDRFAGDWAGSVGE